jgi:hypothetical protein
MSLVSLTFYFSIGSENLVVSLNFVVSFSLVATVLLRVPNTLLIRVFVSEAVGDSTPFLIFSVDLIDLTMFSLVKSFLMKFSLDLLTKLDILGVESRLLKGSLLALEGFDLLVDL